MASPFAVSDVAATQVESGVKERRSKSRPAGGWIS